MSSRQQEKQQRREERLAQQQAAQRAAGRRRRLQMVGGAVLAAAAVVAVVVAVTASGGNGKPGLHGGGVTITRQAIPARQITNLTAAAKAAACVVLNPPSEGRIHVLTSVTYKTNPPSSGNHYPVPPSDGIYDPGSTPAKEHLVHALEHGRIEIQYKPGTSPFVIGQLEQLGFEFQSQGDPRWLLFQNQTNMPYAIAAVAWTHILGCKTYSPKVFDAIRAFKDAFDLKAPEQQFIGAE